MDTTILNIYAKFVGLTNNFAIANNNMLDTYMKLIYMILIYL